GGGRGGVEGGEWRVPRTGPRHALPVCLSWRDSISWRFGEAHACGHPPPPACQRDRSPSYASVSFPDVAGCRSLATYFILPPGHLPNTLCRVWGRADRGTPFCCGA